MATFILVHGAFGTPRELEPVAPHLEALGHSVLAVDLPCETPTATLMDYARAAAAVVERVEGRRVVVGHSAGGATISLVPGLARVDQLVYVTAVVPEPGRSVLELAGPNTRATLADITIDHGDGRCSFNIEKLVEMAPESEREAIREYLVTTQRSQGWAAMEEPWPGERLPGVPAAYVLCTEDQLLSPEVQAGFAARLGVTPYEIASDHEVFGLKPAELAAILGALVE